ncbi:MAG: DUF4249 family protein [Bacteroidota bacterium]
MKNAPWDLLIILCLFLESCNSDFNINAPHQDVYVLNCILRNDTSIQYATISKNYSTGNGAAPAPNTIVPNIKGVNIQIFNNDSVFIMRDTTVELTDSGNSVQVDCYYLRNLVMKPGGIIGIEADLPDGQTLKSTKQMPVCYTDPSAFTFPQSYFTVDQPEIGVHSKQTYIKFPPYSWLFTRDKEVITDMLSFPQLEIDYEEYEGGTYVGKKTLVPLAYGTYTNIDSTWLSPDLNFSFDYTASTSLETVDKMMQEISGSDPYKNNYIITKFVFTITGMDPELTRYYSAYEVWLNSFTVKLRPTDYSNIEGGKGIFGVYYKYSVSLVVDKDYINSFGYQYDPSRY